MEMKIELVPVPVTDTDRAIEFYTKQMSFNLGHDFRMSDTLRFVQLTPQTSACSIVIGEGITEMVPGTQTIQVVIKDAAKSREQLIANGVSEVSEVDPQDWGTFVHVKDPDGNTWSLQQMPVRDQPAA